MMYKQPIGRGLPSEDRLHLAVALFLFFAASMTGIWWSARHSSHGHDRCPASDFVLFNSGF